ncbi:zinc-binding alcohol dehydrogenase family protein [Staphylococcus canis]|uniref:Zinc-binding alcohol dehydrogenase family protein n=1 Tax=Staphylococcus canis TaxID=2724942 RepID=A0ABS0T6U1_9STAP|nr:zinc-binding alcohol dehydrogenase family protein [Staphylococcus canis]MBI5974397.1 zinc-binding alcohol dehydrogenase family protein [Staphylococcus canis]
MKSLAIVNTNLVSKEDVSMLPTIKIADSSVSCAIVDVKKPSFDSVNVKNENYVLVKVDAFSCNYRDKAIILKSALKMQGDLNFQAAPFSFFGSDFVATIIDKGKSVTEFEINDRVIPNCAYPESPFPGVAPGVVTNEASKGWLRLHKSKLIKIPKEMSNEIAAGYSIGGQTSTSMVRKVNLQDNEKALVLSGRSNTSMFIIDKLLSKKIDTTILTTSDWTNEEKALVYPAKIVHVSKGDTRWDENYNLDKYDAVFDPFFDLHLSKAIKVLNKGGRYITCGYKNQHHYFKENIDKYHKNDLNDIMLKVMINNISLIGNCIGTSKDLENSLESFNAQTSKVPVDSVFSIEKGNEFIEKTYNNNKRLGKSIMIY